MPRWHYPDGSSRTVSQTTYELYQEQEEANFMECFCLAKWFAWCEWVSEFGENNPNFPFNPNSRIVFEEAARLQQYHN